MLRLTLITLVAMLSCLTVEASLVGIRLVFEEQNIEGMGCTKDEHNTVVSVMHDGIIDLMEQQPSSRELMFDDDGSFNFDDGVGDVTDPGWCKSACRNYARGTCYV